MRFNPNNYNPSNESSPISAALLKRIEGDVTKLLVIDASPIEDGVKACESGSRLGVSSEKVRFNTGKDAALKGKLVRAHVTGTKVVLVRPDDDGKSKLVPVTSLAATKAHYPKFESFLVKAAKAQAAKPAPKPRPPAKSADEKKAAAKAKADAKKADTTPGDDPKLVGATVEFKIGRNTKTGQVVKVEGGKATIEYETAGGSKTTRVVSQAAVKIVD